MGRASAVAVLPALVTALLFYLALGHRRDYLGHFAAGYGATLCAAAVHLAALPAARYGRFAAVGLLACTVACIAAGAVAEATVFRLAKFDEIDFCNQSLGAVLAGSGALALAGAEKPSDAMLWTSVTVGAAFLAAGAYFAFT
jgi:hypothetical protein